MENKKFHYVYKITNTNPTDKRRFYIGVRSSSCQPKADIKYLSSSKPLIESIEKQGKENFTKEILSIWETRKEAVLEEIRLHELFNVGANPEYYNRAKQTNIGFDTAGCKLTRRPKLSEEEKERIKKENKLKANAKISKAMKGRKESDETRLKKSIAFKGRIFSDESKKKMTEARKGWKNPNKGKKCPQLTGEKNGFFGKEHTIKIKQIIKEKTKIWFENLSEEEKKSLVEKRAETTIKNGSQKGKNNPQAKIYKITSPSGEVIICNGDIEIFCRNQNLDYSTMRNIARGKKPKTTYSKHYGWEVEMVGLCKNNHL